MAETHETEAKLKIDDHTPVREALHALDAEPIGRLLQTDTYFDSEDARLFETGCGLRIRTVEPLGEGEVRQSTDPLVTFKGPLDPSSAVKRREEIETHCGSAEAMQRLLGVFDMQPRLIIQKRRESFLLDDCRIELDELPNIGCFVEIEGPSESAVSAVQEKLGLGGRESICDSYLHLAMSLCGRLGGACKTLTFDTCDNCPHAGQ
ncbi:MAG: class IV adenylate cyclase [Phycisphaerae bacterium]